MLILTEVLKAINLLYIAISITIMILAMLEGEDLILISLIMNKEQLKWNSTFAITVLIFDVTISHI